MSNFYDSLEDRIFRIILKEIENNKNILDIGCGSCKLVLFLAGQLNDAQVTGIDLRGWEFPDISQNTEEKKIKNKVKCLKADAADLNSFQDGSFDAVTSVYSLHEFRLPLEALHEAYRVLKNKGKAVIVDFIKDTRADKLWGERYYTPGKIEAMLEKTGFSNIGVELVSKQGPVICTGIKE
ncbi:MAG: class I SAM-dependent methyltransferase [Spirochaetota bacterium]